MGESAPEEWKYMWGAKIKWPADMPDDILKFSVDTATQALEECEDWEKQGESVVEAVKKKFDAQWGPHWHVIIGKNFGSFVTHETERFLYFYVGDKAVMVFKSS